MKHIMTVHTSGRSARPLPGMENNNAETNALSKGKPAWGAWLMLVAVLCGLLPVCAQNPDGSPDGGYPIAAADMHMRDPFVTVDRENNCYYIITTRWKDGRGGLVAYKSEDLEHWREEGFVFQADPDYPGTDDYWAPDTYFYKGNYYCFLTLSNRKEGILRGTTILKSESGTPMGPYKPVLPPQRLNMTPDTMQCLDGSLYVDKEGTPWMVFAVEWCGPNVSDKVGEVWAQQLNDSLTGTVGEPHRLFRASEAEWPLHIGHGMVTDAPFVWEDKHSGHLIMLWSSFSPLYSIGQAISKSGDILGPWEQETVPLFDGNGGHQMVFEDLEGNLKISFHSPNSPEGGKRETLTIKDVCITGDGKMELADGCHGTANRPFRAASPVNPVRSANGQPLFVADPFVFRHGSTYYLTGTTGGNGFGCYTSADLQTWEYKGHLYQAPEGHPGNSCFWAPEVKRYNGRYYLTYSCYMPEYNNALTCLAVSNTPEGPYTDLHTPWLDFGYSAIDAHLFVDNDGTPYLYYSKNGMMGDSITTGEIYAVRLKADLSGADGQPVSVCSASQGWEKVRWDRNRCNEGPYVFRHKGKYYMTYSANDTGYQYYGIGVARADHPLGPWKKDRRNPLLTTDPEAGVSSPGHNSLVTDIDGNLFMVYHRHADPQAKKPDWNRVTCVSRISLDRHGRIRVEKDEGAE